MTRSAKEQDDFQRAAALQNSGDFAAAFTLYRKLFPRHQNNPKFLTHMAICAVSLGKHNQARNLALSIVRRHPNAGAAHNILGVLALNDNDLPKAITHFKDFVSHAPTSVEAHLNLSEALNKINCADEAAQHQRRACELAPKRADVFYIYGVTLRALGRMDEAVAQFRQVLNLTPYHAGAWKVLAELHQLDTDTDLPAMIAALGNAEDNTQEQAKMHFAMANLHEQNEDFDQAFDHFDRANALVRATLDYDVADDERLMSKIAATFQPKLLERFEGRGVDSHRPIFIVGMPRSGTTLVEQILAGHSDVYAGDELSFFADALQAHGTLNGVMYPQAAKKWSQKTLTAIAKSYLNSLDALNVDRPYITDKMPSNFLYLGAIRAVFPHAKIVHCLRDPIDTCLGNYRQMFTVGQHFSYDQDDLVRYYKSYQRLMDHWRSLFGEAILDVRYEDVVQAPEDQARKIVAHCGLAWQDACVNLKQSKRAVYTASAAQVRDGIHTKYLERWRKYTPYIQPMLDGFSVKIAPEG